jgi:uncharacterized glyoxalase superfamily protein PhnB
MQLNPYLSFNGQCEAAFKFYEQCLDGQIGAIFGYAGTLLADQVPPDWQEKVMNGTLTVGELVLMGGDVAPDRYEEPKRLLALAPHQEHDRGRACFSRAEHRRQGCGAARENVLGRPF